MACYIRNVEGKKSLKPNGSKTFTGHELLLKGQKKTFLKPLTISKGVARVVNERDENSLTKLDLTTFTTTKPRARKT